MGRSVMASGPVGGMAIRIAFACVWLSVVSTTALQQEDDIATLDVVSAEETASTGKKGIYYCTAKGDNSPDYAYNDKNCEANGLEQQCGEVWCCSGEGPAAGLYSCSRAQKRALSVCAGLQKPKCSGPKPTGAGSTKIVAITKGGGCKDSHTAICKAAKVYGHCKKSSYAKQCPKSCGSCGKKARREEMNKQAVKRVLAKVAAKKVIASMKKRSMKNKTRSAEKRQIKKEAKKAKKIAKKISKNKAKLKKAKKKLLKKAKKKKKKDKDTKKKAKKGVKRAMKKVSMKKKILKKAKNKRAKNKSKLAAAKAKLRMSEPTGGKVTKAKAKIQYAKSRLKQARKSKAKTKAKLGDIKPKGLKKLKKDKKKTRKLQAEVIK